MIRHNASAHERKHARNTLVTTGFAVVLLFSFTSLAPAQNSTSVISPRSATTAGTTGQGTGMRGIRSPMQAPVGHFQPSPRQTPSLGHEDISRTRGEIDLDKSLRICRDC